MECYRRRPTCVRHRPTCVWRRCTCVRRRCQCVMVAPSSTWHSLILGEQKSKLQHFSWKSSPKKTLDSCYSGQIRETSPTKYKNHVLNPFKQNKLYCNVLANTNKYGKSFMKKQSYQVLSKIFCRNTRQHFVKCSAVSCSTRQRSAV